jgi:arginyl-tRNA--protein-N-Asp/Glu arginylyltransferase
MHDSDVSFLNQQFFADSVTAEQLDVLLEQGWRHFGNHFFRYSYAFYELDVRQVIPLRIRLDRFSLSKSQRRTLKKNQDLQTTIGPIRITGECELLFARHKTRFNSGVPESIYDFLSRSPATEPCEAFEFVVYENDRLVAVSYFDQGETSMSGIYAMFEPDVSHRRLGIFSLLKEIEYAIKTGKEFYYLGYAYQGPSFYDYKKRFRGSEAFDWAGNWKTFDVQAWIDDTEA